MSSNVGTWSPNDLILPTVESDLDYKFFLVKESGRIDGLDISFNAGDWLVYVKEHGIGNWYKTAGGAAVFSISDAANFPDPGFYTRVRLDNVGRIIDADYLSKDDLPKHDHDISTITGDWESKIKSYVAEMFQNQSDATIKFIYDKETKTLSADLSVDGDTITCNEWGELVATGSGGEGGSGSTNTNPNQSLSGKVKIEQVETLEDKLLAIDSNIQKNFIVCRQNSGLEAKQREEGTYLSVKIDGTSLVLNSEGEISVSRSVLLGGSPDGSDLTCGSHTHTSSQITDFEEAVLDIVKDNVKFNIQELPVDGETVIINSKGQLACIAAGTRAHTHVMKDIEDLNPKIANVWASQQALQPDENYKDGALDISGRTIGYSIKVINEYLKDINERLEKVETKVNTLDIPVPNNIEFATISLDYSGKVEVVDINTREIVEAGLTATFKTDLFYPANQGKIDVILDNNVIYSLQMDENTRLYSSTNFMMTDIKDSYYTNPMFRGVYESMSIQYKVGNIAEGYHSIRFVHTYGGESHSSPKQHFQIFNKSKPNILLTSSSYPKNNDFVSGVPCYRGDGKIVFSPKVVNAFTSCFMNKVIYQYSQDSGETWETPVISSIFNGSIYFDPITIYAPKGVSGSIKILERAFNANNEVSDSHFNIPSIIWNETDVEQYRIVHVREYDDQSPKTIGIQPHLNYNSKDKLQNYEMAIRNNIGSLVRVDYSNIGGPDYSTLNSDKYNFTWCTLRFEAPFMNNLHLKILHEGGVSFEKTKFGTLVDLKLFVGVGDNESNPMVWVDGNSPYNGYSTFSDGVDNDGLDLFKSDIDTRYVTFGQRPTSNYGYLFIKVGVTTNIDLGVLVKSVKESINEWS